VVGGTKGFKGRIKTQRGLRRLMWVLDSKETASMHMGAISQHHLALMMINFQLLVERRLCHAEMFGWSGPLRYSAMRQEVNERFQSDRPCE
jgi:hypothetical protein